jgi:hypothetical protein
MLYVLYLDIDPTWWRLLQTHVVRTIFRHWSYLMKVITDTCCTYYIYTLILPDEGYYRHVLYVLYLDIDPSWWRLLQTRVLRTIFRHRCYLMKVIIDTCCTYYIWTLILPDEGYYRHLYVLYLDIDPTWWRLLQTPVVRTIFRHWFSLMKVITDTCCTYYIYTLILPDGGYNRHALYVIYLDIDPTSWRLLQTGVVRTIFRHWSYLMKVITDTCCTYYI